MLVLGRRVNEGITITTPSGEVIKLAVVQNRGGTVKLAFDADKAVTIVRDELLRKPL